jgi:hypothetical protein
MVSGCVVIDNRPDVPIPPISLTFTGASRADAAARPDGVFRIDLPEGKYRVAINALPPGFSLKSIKINTTDLLRSPLNVNSAALPGIVVHLEQNAGAAPPRK